MTNSTLCDVRPRWAGASSSRAQSEPSSFPERLKMEARESADRYVRKRDCDKARKRALATDDPTFVDNVAQRCIPNRPQ
jgi:hypothetical protein